MFVSFDRIPYYADRQRVSKARSAFKKRYPKERLKRWVRELGKEIVHDSKWFQHKV
jgi:hypothetical protein